MSYFVILNPEEYEAWKDTIMSFRVMRAEFLDARWEFGRLRLFVWIILRGCGRIGKDDAGECSEMEERHLVVKFSYSSNIILFNYQLFPRPSKSVNHSRLR